LQKVIFWLPTVLLNNTLHFTYKCRVLYMSYKCRTEGQTSSMAFHGAILHPLQHQIKKTRARRKPFGRKPDSKKLKLTDPIDHRRNGGNKSQKQQKHPPDRTDALEARTLAVFFWGGFHATA